MINIEPYKNLKCYVQISAVIYTEGTTLSRGAALAFRWHNVNTQLRRWPNDALCSAEAEQRSTNIFVQACGRHFL